MMVEVRPRLPNISEDIPLKVQEMPMKGLPLEMRNVKIMLEDDMLSDCCSDSTMAPDGSDYMQSWSTAALSNLTDSMSSWLSADLTPTASGSPSSDESALHRAQGESALHPVTISVNDLDACMPSTTDLIFKEDFTDGVDEPGSPVQLPLAGVARENSMLPSVGAALHSTGQCRPCAWVWSPQGCFRGADCQHCHACPAGEIRRRKQEKHAAARANADSCDVAETNVAIAPAPVPYMARPSLGAVLHGTGQCKPCAWYWKPGSCVNGFECQHCHMCPEDELKTRKKGKVARLRLGHQACLAQEEEELEVLREMSLTQPPPQLGAPRSSAEKLAVSGTPAKIADTCMELAIGASSPDLPSIGSELHASGNCKPCAWIHKPGGCSNGQQCCHCHLCPQGELKNRKKRAKELAIERVKLREQAAPESCADAGAPVVLQIHRLLQ
mmetsp:Transcript_1411/g.2315  ORF Transcript_1411/g.2315 Transcript_1411/m.2315 type:complete len:441 (+) Transcript_1411:140-1462(+)